MMLAECEVCLECYDARKRVPRSLSCKHTLCTSCIAQIMRRGQLKCPFCRTLHASPVISPADVPVHEEMAALVAEDSSLQQDEMTSGINVLKLRSDVQKANANGADVWAVLRTEVGYRCAKITVHDNRLHLRALKDGEPPKDAQTVEYEVVRKLVDDEYVVVFLEVTKNNSLQGRVYIKLFDDAGRTRQFMYFCSGERGPSYANTRFLEVLHRGQPGEQVWGGDYENDNGTGGSALPGMERGEENFHSIVPGLVVGYYFPGYGYDHNPSQFGIYVAEWCYMSDMSSIGMVIDGLDIISSLPRLANIKQGCVSDCGFLLFH